MQARVPETRPSFAQTYPFLLTFTMLVSERVRILSNTVANVARQIEMGFEMIRGTLLCDGL